MRITVFDTPVICQLLRGIATLILKLAGWKVEGQKPTVRRYVLIGAPHTSNWDFVIFMAVALKLRMPMFWLGKNTLFRGPMGPVMRYLGGIPVYRQRKNNMVGQAVAAFNCHSRFVLALAPEGTRSKVNEWKTGFWHIAHDAKVPVVPAYVDFTRKIAGIGATYKLTGDKKQDIANLQTFYAPYRGRRPSEESPLATPIKADAN